MKIGLGLIVKNEEVDIAACLESFLPHVDAVCLVDTGSTDRTLDIAREIFDRLEKPNKIISFLDANDAQGRLCDFSAARNVYVRDLESYGVDFIFSADADDTLVAPADLHAHIEAHDDINLYSIKYLLSETQHIASHKLWRTGLGIRWTGRVHECLTIPWERIKCQYDQIIVKHNPTSHEGQEHSGQRNLRILRDEIYPSFRSMFYWANENVDAGNYEEAIKWYLEYIRRAKAGEKPWMIELAHCYWRAARWLHHLQRTEEAEALCLELLTYDATWSEAWCELAYINRLRGDFEGMRCFAKKALENKFVSRLFSEPDKYTTTPANMLLIAAMHDKIAKKV